MIQSVEKLLLESLKRVVDNLDRERALVDRQEVVSPELRVQ